jgi:hypothetical protein
MIASRKTGRKRGASQSTNTLADFFRATVCGQRASLRSADRRHMPIPPIIAVAALGSSLIRCTSAPPSRRSYFARLPG